MGNRLHPTMGKSRERWLSALLNGPQNRSIEPTRAVADCDNLGWTEAVYQLGAHTATRAELDAAHGGFSAWYAKGWRYHGLYQITPAGRAALQATARDGEPG